MTANGLMPILKGMSEQLTRCCHESEDLSPAREEALDQITVSKADLIEAVVAELGDWFSDPREAGIALQQFEARLIGSRVAARVSKEVGGEG